MLVVLPAFAQDPEHPSGSVMRRFARGYPDKAVSAMARSLSPFRDAGR
jgi:hypothetical protein